MSISLLYLDSIVITRFGEQQSGAKGYNPNKKEVIHIIHLIAFMGQTRMVDNAWFRPDNTLVESLCKKIP
ncbi:hypothetical protein ACSTS3_02655 [Aquimarina muelleri]|uniref:hypothetical protein n=1 Tax=Aquimarina muelleri TaxID=279356 RepID=UPI003F68498D